MDHNEKIETIKRILIDYDDLLFETAERENRCSGADDKKTQSLISFLETLKK